MKISFILEPAKVLIVRYFHDDPFKLWLSQNLI